MYGQHREVIAKTFNVSNGAVEQIIQSHRGLSGWRRHLRFVVRREQARKALLDFMDRHPEALRNEIKNQCSAYSWLYKRDKQWLYEQLPERMKGVLRGPMNWDVRDFAILLQMHELTGPYNSLSALDRALGGHNWLLKYREKLPRSLEYAYRHLLTVTNDR